MTTSQPVSANSSDATSVRRLLLFVAENEPNSVLARTNLAAICQDSGRCRCDLTIVDVYQDYQTALEHNILITPCLLLLEPTPSARIVGTLSDTKQVCAILRLSQ
jgi:circadian clock protein KaiB